MFRKVLTSLFLAIGLLIIVTIFAAAQGSRPKISQMDMSTPTATAALEPTPVPELPLNSNLPLSGAQTGTCPMMNGTGMDMTGMSGMGMGSMGMGGMMGGMSGMQGMTGMTGMTGMSSTMTAYAVPWYNDPWQILGWILVVLVTGGILFGLVVGVKAILGRPKPVQGS